MGKILDCTNLNAEYTRKLNKIASRNKKRYTRFVDIYSKEHGHFYMWWATPFASRNINLDATFQKICFLHLCQEVMEKDQVINHIILDDKALYDTLFINFAKKLTSKGITLEYRKKDICWFSAIARSIKQIKSLFEEYMKIRWHACKDGYSLKESISLIDTPILSSCFEDGQYRDRYFGDIHKYIKRDIYFVPSFNKNSSLKWKEFVERVEHSKQYKFLLKEKFLSVFDYSFLLKYLVYCIYMSTKKYKYENMDVTPLVKSSLLKGSYCTPSLKGILNYRYIKKLKKNNVKVDNLISWYEGRPSEIMMQKAFREYYPAAGSVGYEGFPLLESSLSLYLSKEQVRQKSAPLKMAIPGAVYEGQAKQFYERIDLIKVPILRNKYTNESSHVSLNQQKKILVVLPYFEKAAENMLHIVNEYMRAGHGSYNIIIKNHPVLIGKTVDYYLKEEIYFEPQYIEGTLVECMKDIDLAYISCSTAALEVIAQGVFLVNLCSAGELINTGIPDSIDNKLYRVVYDERETFEAFDYCLQRREKEVNMLDVGELLEPINEETINRMWN